MEPKSTARSGYAELKAFLAKRRQTSQAGAVPGVPGSGPRAVFEKRREARYQTRDAVEVEILQIGFQRVAAFIVDISRSGLSLLSESTIGKGSQVKITLEKQVVIFGEVQYCRQVRDGYHSGILIQDVFYPQRQAGKPKEKDRNREPRRAQC